VCDAAPAGAASATTRAATIDAWNHARTIDMPTLLRETSVPGGGVVPVNYWY
jgi:hypothetical protein